MTPEIADYLNKAREFLSKAQNLLDVMHYADEAARAAYLAGFHAAQGLILARTGRAARTHSGVRSSFARLTKDEPHIDRKFARFLARAYSSKEVTDYGIGPHAVVTAAEAQAMIEVAAEPVDRMTEILA